MGNLHSGEFIIQVGQTCGNEVFIATHQNTSEHIRWPSCFLEGFVEPSITSVPSLKGCHFSCPCGSSFFDQYWYCICRYQNIKPLLILDLSYSWALHYSQIIWTLQYEYHTVWTLQFEHNCLKTTIWTLIWTQLFEFQHNSFDSLNTTVWMAQFEHFSLNTTVWSWVIWTIQFEHSCWTLYSLNTTVQCYTVWTWLLSTAADHYTN